SNPVQQQRWQNFLDAFSFPSSMPDMVNLKYLVYEPSQYQREKPHLGDKYVPVFRSPDGTELVLENRSVMPKAWLVPAAGVVDDPRRSLGVLQSPGFNPWRVALVETPPPIPLGDPNAPPSAEPGPVKVLRYEGERIHVEAAPTRNALLVLGEKYYRGWRAAVDGKPVRIYPVNHVLRGVYLTPGKHTVDFVFDPLPFKIGKWLTLASFAFFGVMLGRDVWKRRVKRYG
ncbi:MAG: YfhO family protein, partial [Geobacteraceae bacterium]|nr:YfhO family protein [Geobacteraceae bacterium]